MKFNIDTFLEKNFELKSEEVKIFKLLFLHSFFVGWFIAFYFASANAQFIKYFGSKQLPFAYILSGIVGYIFATFYSFLQKRTNTKVLFSSTLILMFVIAIAGRLFLNAIDTKLLSLFVFIWAWPFISLSNIEIGGLSLRFLNLIQVKRLYGLFNMGGVLAAIISYFGFAILKPYFKNIYDFLLIASAGILFSYWFLIKLYKIKDDPDIEKAFRTEKQKSSIKQIISDKYLVWIFVSAILSMMMIFITDFGFLSSVKAVVPVEKTPQYLALVYGLLKVGELIISYYSRRLLSNYGVKTGLTILPIISTSIVAITAIWGIILGINWGFLILFTTLKSLERIIRRGLDDPAFNILYQPLNDDKKLAIQSRVGIVMQFATALAGLILLIFNIFLQKENYLLEFFPLLFLPILIIWLFVAINLYNSYKNKIRQTLSEIGKDKRRGTDQYQYASDIFAKRLNDLDNFSVLLSTTVITETNPKILEPYASVLLKNFKIPTLVKLVTKNVDPTWRKRLHKHFESLLEENYEDNVKKTINYALMNLDFSNINEPLTKQKAQELINSPKVKDKLTLLKYIHKELYDPSDEEMLKLLEDNERIIKITAINVSVQLKRNILIEKIIELLFSEDYRYIAANALIELGGSRVIPLLEKHFNEETDVEILLLIIEIYAKIGTDQAKNLLLKHLNYPQRDVQIAVVFALFYCKFQAKEDQRLFIEQKLNEYIDSILYIYASLNDIEGYPNTLKLYLALDYEKETYFELIFLILSFLYEPRIITLIQKNIVGKDTIFALEIMDNFFDKEIKKLVTYIFDDIPPTSKIKHFSKIFPQKKMNIYDRLKDIILQDYSRFDPYTVSKAIELLGKMHKKQSVEKKLNLNYQFYSDLKIWKKENVMELLERIKKSEIADEIFAALFHPDETVYSIAAKIIFDDNPIKCFDYLVNMSFEKQKLISKLSNQQPLIDDKIRILKKIPLLFNLPEHLLTHFAKICEIANYSQNSTIEIYKNNKEHIIFVVNGLISFDVENENYIFAKNDFIVAGINVDDFTTQLKAYSDSTVIFFERKKFFNLLLNNKDIARYILMDISSKNWILN